MSEEDFFEMNFLYENSSSDNLKLALSVLFEKYKAAESFAEELTSGICMDDAEAEVVLQGIIMAYKFVCRFLAESGCSLKGNIFSTLKTAQSADAYCECMF